MHDSRLPDLGFMLLETWLSTATRVLVASWKCFGRCPLSLPISNAICYTMQSRTKMPRRLLLPKEKTVHLISSQARLNSSQLARQMVWEQYLDGGAKLLRLADQGSGLHDFQGESTSKGWHVFKGKQVEGRVRRCAILDGLACFWLGIPTMAQVLSRSSVSASDS